MRSLIIFVIDVEIAADLGDVDMSGASGFNDEAVDVVHAGSFLPGHSCDKKSLQKSTQFLFKRWYWEPFHLVDNP